MHPSDVVYQEASTTFYALLHRLEVMGDAAAALLPLAFLLGGAIAALWHVVALLRLSSHFLRWQTVLRGSGVLLLVGLVPLAGTSAAAAAGAPAAQTVDRTDGSDRDAVPQTEINKQLILRFYEEAWHNDRYAFADQVFAADYIRHDNSAPVQAGNAPLQSAVAREVKAILPDFRYRYDAVLAEGDLVAVRWTATGTPVGWPAVLRRLVGKSGPIVMTGVNTYRLRDGQVVEIWNNRDDLTRFRESGLLRWYVVGGFLAGVLVALLGAWGVRRWRTARRPRQQMSAA